MIDLKPAPRHRLHRPRRARARVGAAFYVVGVLAYGWLVLCVVAGMLALPEWLGWAGAVSVVTVLLGLWRKK